MKKKLYEAPQLAVVALQTAEILLTVVVLSVLFFRKDGKVNVWG